MLQAPAAPPDMGSADGAETLAFAHGRDHKVIGAGSSAPGLALGPTDAYRSG